MAARAASEHTCDVMMTNERGGAAAVGCALYRSTKAVMLSRLARENDACTVLGCCAPPRDVVCRRRFDDPRHASRARTNAEARRTPGQTRHGGLADARASPRAATSRVLLHSDCFCSHQYETSSKRGGSKRWHCHLRPIRTLECILLGQIRHPDDPPPAGPTPP